MNDKYELDSYYSVEADNGRQQGFDCFLSQVDIVYIKTEQPKREKYIRRSLELGKYVISDAPMTDNKGKLKDLFALAAARHVLLVEKINLVYLRAFNQLVWPDTQRLGGRYCVCEMLYFPGPFRRRKKFFRNCSSAFVCYYQDTGQKLPGSEFQCGEGQIWKLHLRHDHHEISGCSCHNRDWHHSRCGG